jgi:hypothetical protein
VIAVCSSVLSYKVRKGLEKKKAWKRKGLLLFVISICRVYNLLDLETMLPEGSTAPGQFPPPQYPVVVPSAPKDARNSEPAQFTNCFFYTTFAIAIPVGIILLATGPTQCPRGFTEGSCIANGVKFPCRDGNTCSREVIVQPNLAIGILLIVIGGLGILILPCIRSCQSKPLCCCSRAAPQSSAGAVVVNTVISSSVPPSVPRSQLVQDTLNEQLSLAEINLLTLMKHNKLGVEECLSKEELAYFTANVTAARKVIRDAGMTLPPPVSEPIKPEQMVTKEDIKRLRLEKAIKEERYSDAERILDSVA